MESPNFNFIAAVLGESGAAALAKAAERSVELSHAFVPRTILAWLQAESEYEGAIPGVGTGYVNFRKNEHGFSGSIQVGAGMHKFEDESLFHVAASVAVALGLDHGKLPESARDIDIERLGRSIDVLAKARRVAVALQKSSPPGKYNDLPEELKARGYSADSAFAIAWAKHNAGKKVRKEELDSFEEKFKKDELEKSGPGTGVAHAPTAPKPPTPPVAPNTTPAKPKPPTTGPKPPKAPKPQAPTMQLTRSEAEHPCPSCGQPQFRGDVFRGCLCFSAFAKSVTVMAANPGGITVQFDPADWGPDELMTFRESVGRE